MTLQEGSHCNCFVDHVDFVDDVVWIVIVHFEATEAISISNEFSRYVVKNCGQA